MNKLKHVGWCILQSWWLVLVVFPLTNWAGFLYISLRTRNKAWGAFAAAYALLTILTLSNSSHPMASIGIVFIYLAGVIHGFVENVRFLRKIDKNYKPKQRYFNNQWYPPGQEPIQGFQPYQGAHPNDNAGYPSAARSPINLGNTQQVNEYVRQETGPNEPVYMPSMEQFVAPLAPEPSPSTEQFVNSSPILTELNVNVATVEQFAALPGFDLHLARLAVQLREQEGELYSVEQFAEKLGLGPHMVLQLRPILTFTVTT